MRQFVKSVLGSKDKGDVAKPTKRAGFRPGLENLEDRLTPACTVTTAYGGTALIITGDNNVNDVAIIQDDANNTLTVLCDGAAPQVFSSSLIKSISTDLKGGDDNLWWGLAPGSNFQFEKGAYLATGDGNDEIELSFWHGIGNPALIQSSLGIVVDAGEGDDILNANFARKHGGNLTLLAKMGAGNDEAYARIWGNITGGAKVKFDLQGGSGDDLLSTWNTYNNELDAYGSIKVSSDSQFQINMNGGSNDDHIYLTYAGELDGKLILNVYGGMGNDVVRAAEDDGGGIYLQAGSFGELDAKFEGNQGNDSMALTVKENLGSSVDVNALLDGGQDWDFCDYGNTTSNVTKVAFENLWFFPIVDFNLAKR